MYSVSTWKKHTWDALRSQSLEIPLLPQSSPLVSGFDEETQKLIARALEGKEEALPSHVSEPGCLPGGGGRGSVIASPSLVAGACQEARDAQDTGPQLLFLTPGPCPGIHCSWG